MVWQRLPIGGRQSKVCLRFLIGDREQHRLILYRFRDGNTILYPVTSKANASGEPYRISI